MKKEYKYWNWAQEHLTELGVKTDVMDRYNEEHRFYHTWEHIEDLFSQIKKQNLLDNDTLFLATIFHDAIYDPKLRNNEEKSVELFKQMYKGNLSVEVEKIILETKHHKSSGELSDLFSEMDLDILSRPLDQLIAYENKIFKEFQYLDWTIYREKRIGVLNLLQGDKSKFNLDNLITYVGSRTPNIGLLCASFDPMHIGHYNILTKAEHIFDKVILARGRNTEKGEYQYPLMPERVQYRQIESYKGLLTDFLKGLKYEVTLVRGLRNANDLHNEMTQFRFLQDMMPNIKMVTLFCDKEFEHISSSAVRQLKPFNKDSKYKL